MQRVKYIRLDYYNHRNSFNASDICMVIYLVDVMKHDEEEFNRRADSNIKEIRASSFKYAERWNKIRKIIEFQESQMLRRVS